MEVPSSPGGTWRKHKAMGEVSSQYKKFMFYSEDNQSQIQSCQGSGSVPITADFQDKTEQHAR